MTIRESYGNGAVTKVERRDSSTGDWHEVWSGVDPTAAGAALDFEVNFQPTSYLADGVRITIDTNHSPAWEEIDAVGLYAQGQGQIDKFTGGPGADMVPYAGCYQGSAGDGVSDYVTVRYRKNEGDYELAALVPLQGTTQYLVLRPS